MEKALKEVLDQYSQSGSGDLITILQEIQIKRGFLSEEAVTEVAKLLDISTTKIYGLATFYDQFRFYPEGRIHFRICHGSTCYLSGSGKTIETFREQLGIEPGVTSKDGRFSFEISSCMGGCGLGPNVYVNGKFVTSVSPAKVREMLLKLKYSDDNG